MKQVNKQIRQLLCLIILLGSVLVSRGQYANGTGTGLHQKEVFWLDWDAPVSQPAGATATNIAAGTYVWQLTPTLQIQAIVSNITTVTKSNYGNGVPLTLGKKNVGTFLGNGSTTLGDGLQILYPGPNPIAIATSTAGAVANDVQSGEIRFDIAVNLRLLIGGAYTNIAYPGMVVGDAESMATNTTNDEYISGHTNATTVWQLFDLRNDAASIGRDPSEYKLEMSNSGRDFKLHINVPRDDIGVQAVMYAHGATSLTNLQMRGRGITAMAVGFVIPFDFGDAPLSYGNAGNYMDNFSFTAPFSGTTGTYAPSNLTKATLIPSAKLYMGSNDVDADGNPPNSVNADADGADDNDATFPASINPNQTGSIVVTTTATNTEATTATIYAWIDFDRDGQFEANELVTATAPAGNSNTAKTLTWANSSFASIIQPGITYARIRITTTALTDNTATTNVDERSNAAAADGETEDYRINIFTPITGTVFNDVNGLLGTPVNTVDGTPIGRPAAATLYVNLLNAAGTTVVDTVTVRADGTYTLNTSAALGNYILQLSTVKGTIGSAAPATSLPAGWANTGEFLGTGTGSDGTVSGTLPITIGTTSTANANFGIDARPIAGSGTNGLVNFTTQTQITVPANTFTNTAVSSDATPGGVTAIRITALPTGANSIVINGTTYGPGFTAFPAAGVIVPTDGNGSPLQTITVDPTATGNTTVTILFVARDAAGVESSNTGTAVLTFPAPIVISGNIFDDANGLIGTPANTVDGIGTGTAGGVQLYLNLVGTGNLSFVLDTFRVNANGTYSFEAAPNRSYTLQLSTTKGTIEAAPAANTLPPGWVFTGENVGAGAGNDGNDGILGITVGTTNITNANFGIEAIPVGSNKTLTALPNPGGTATVQVPVTAFTATDLEDAPTGYANNLAGRSVGLAPVSGGTLYYNGTAVTSQALFTSFDPTKVTFDPAANGVTTGSFGYAVYDNAGNLSAGNLVTLSFSDLSISGMVYNDTTTNGVVDGTLVNFVGTNTLYAILLNGTTIVSSQAIGSNGTTGAYSFTTANGVVAGTSYNVIISNSPTSIAPALTGALFNSETDGTPNGSITLPNVTASVSGQNFGIAVAGYIYVQKKTVDESSSVDFTFTGSGSIGNIVLNDNPTQIAVKDIGSSASGRLYAVGTATTNLYYRDLGSSAWVNTGITGVATVDGGPASQCYLITTGGSVLFYSGTGTTTTTIGAATNYGSSNATDIGDAWDNTPFIVTAAGLLYKYSGTGTTWVQVGTSTNNTKVDGYPTGSGCVVLRSDSRVYRITAANVETSLDFPHGTSAPGGDVAVDVAGNIYVSYATIGFSTNLVYKYTGGISWSSAELTSNVNIITAGIGGQVWGTSTGFGNATPYGNIFTRTVNGTTVFWLDDERVRTSPANGNSRMVAVLPGTYTITETVPAGWYLETVTVADPTTNSTASVVAKAATLAVAAGETVATVFTNVLVNTFTVVNDCSSQYLENFGTGATGTFGAPLTGQTSYHYLAEATNAADGYYKVVSYSKDFAGFSSISTNFDHTTNDGNGRFMAVNAAYDSLEFFRRRFTGLVVGATYTFSSYLINLTNSTIKPNVSFVVQNPTDFSTVAKTSSGDITSFGVWTQYSLTFVATATTLDLSLVNNSVGGNGNDLGLDDISFKLAPPPGTLTTTLTNGSCSTAGTITVTAPLGSIYEYSINGTTFQASPTFTNVAAGTYVVTARYVGSINCGLTAAVTLSPSICGNVFNDVNGNAIKDGTEPFITNGSVYANLVNGTNNVVQSVQVAADGSYSFNTVSPGTAYKIILTTSSQTAGATLTTATLPAGFANTGINLAGTANTGNQTGIINIMSGSANLVNQNFAIEALPIAGGGANSATNPGGTTQVTVPATTFTNIAVSSDPAPGGVTSIRITALPASATSIVIGNTTYGAGFTAFPAGGVIVPTDANGNPTVAISVDPAAATTPNVTLPFVAIDAAGKESANTGTAVLNLLAPINITGNVFNDVNGNAVKETGEIITGGVYATLVNPVTNAVIRFALIDALGNYSLTANQNTPYKLVLTNSLPTVGATLTASTLPAGFTNTGVNLSGVANTANQTGIISFTTGGADLTAQNFGIEALPTAGSGANSATNPGGTTQVTVPASTFTNTAVSTDPTPGAVTAIRITALPTGATTIFINGVQYGPGFTAFPAGGVVVPTDVLGNPTQTITVDPALATTPNVTIPFVAIDAAGKESANTSNAVLNLLAPITVSGSVFNDVNGNAIADGTEPFITNGSVYANLVDASNAVVQSVVVNGLGNYTFNTVSQNTAYSIVLTNSGQTVGASLTTATLPAGFAHTGVNLGGTANTANQTGIISFTTAGTNITAQNFGIEALPIAGSGSNGGTNPTGAIQVPVPASTFTSTTASSDPTPGAVTAIRITALPTGATTIVINGTTYGPGFTAFPAGGVIVPTDANGNPTQTITVDPSATGATTVTIPFVARDAAGKESANTGTAVLNLLAPVTISGNVFDDPNGNAVQDAGEPLIVNGSIYANLVNPTTNAVLQSVVVDGTGNYTFSNASQNTAYKVVLTNNSQTVGASLTASTLPAGFVNTGVNLGGTANTANQTGIVTLTTATTNVTAQNFAIEALPTAGSGANTATNRGGTSQATVPASTFTNTTLSSDPTPGAVTAIRITALPTGATTIVINGTTYGPGFTAFPAGGVIVPTDASGNPTQTITVDPAAIGATTVTIPFVARDAAGRESTNAGTAVINFLAPVAISGNVFNDVNGNAIFDGADQFITNGSVYANLVNPATNAVLQSVLVTNTGSYSFPIVSQNTNYNVILTTASQTGNPNLTASTLPAGFVNTGVNLNGVANTANQTGIINFTTTTVDLAAQNFGIEALPVAGSGSLNNVTNPGGTVRIAVPASTFTNITASNDPTPGSITGIRITALPAGAATITINGTTYGPGFTAFPAGGVIVTTDTSGNPTVPITVDPAVDGATTVTISFVARDAAGKESANTGTAVINLLAPITISGNVFDDANGNAIKEAGESLIINGSVYANLVNPITNAVIQSVQVDGTGSYTFNGASQNTAYGVVLTNSVQAVNTVLTASTLPAGFVNTGVNLNGTANVLNQAGIISFTTGTANTTAQNFGIDATPTVTGYTATGLSNPGGTATVLVPAASFMGTDPEDGSYGTGLSGRSVILSPATGGTLFYNGVSVTAATTVTGFNPALVTFDPTASGATTGTFTYNVLDNAGRPSATPATVTLQFVDLNISGIVFNDPNANAMVDGTATGVIGSNNLFAILVSGTTIIATQPVAANGTYSFGTANGIIAGNNYTVIISNTDAGITPTLTGAVYNSETDGMADGIISLVNLTASVTNQNFGIDRLPTVNSFTAASVTNPGGTVAVLVPAAAFTGTDPEDGTYTNFTGRRVVLGAGVNGTLYYNGMPVPAGGTNVPIFDPTKLTFDPTANGTTTGSFSINVYDNANKPSTTPAIISLPFSDLTISGFVYDDPNTNATVDGVQRGIIGANTLYAVLLDASNNFIARTVVDSANGSYSFGSANGVTAGSSYNIIITNGNTAVTPTLVGAVYNSETDGIVNGSISVTNITASVTGQNFGIDQLPVVNTYTAISVANPGGANTVVVPVAAFTGTDPEDGVYPTGLAGRRVALGAGVNGTLYYDGTAVPAGGTIITGFDPAKVRFDPNDNIAVGVFSYNVYDEANKPSAITATVTLPFSNVTISGTIYDDPNTNAVVDGTPTNAFTGNTLYAVLLNGTTVVSRKAVAIDGTYSFGTSDGVTVGSNYTIVITNGNTAVTPALAGAVYNSEADGSANGSITITNITGDVPNLNFGIDRLPVSDVAALPLQLNPGGTGVVAVPANTFTGSDPEDGTYPTGLTGRKVTLASGTNGNVYYNGILVPTGVGTTINSFDSSRVTFDPTDGSVTSTFTYSVYDNANKPSAPATITIPFHLGVTIAGTIWNDVNGDANITLGEIAAIPATIYANIVNTDGTVVQSVLVTGGTYTSGLVFADSSYRVILTTTAQTTGNFLTASAITTGWASTGVNLGATIGTANNTNRTGILGVSTLGATMGIINRNFGIERIPLANNATAPAQPNFAPYTQTVASSSFSGTDFDLGTVQNVRITSFPTNAQTLVVNGVTYGPGFTAFPAGGITIPAPLGVVPPNIISVKPNPGVITVTIPYVTIDNAGVESIGATVIVPYYVILPVTGLDLTGIRNGNDVVLKWNTLTEQNTALFIVERSFDGRNFERISTAPASGNSNSLKSYTITDRNILKDVVYYRITLVDADGKTTVSNTVTIRLNGFVKSNRVFPNPVQNVINVELGMAGRYTITLYNAAGQQVNTRQVETAGSIITSIYRNNLPAGSYVLKLTNAATRESETFKLILE